MDLDRATTDHEVVAVAPAWTLGAYRGQGVTQDLRHVPGAALDGNLDYADSRETAIFARRDIVTPDWLAWTGRATGAPVRAQAVVTAYSASGLARNRAVAVDWRAAIAPSVGAGLSVEVAFGVGWWHAFGTPWYNHGGNREWDGKYHNLLHVVPELSLRHGALPGWSLGVRIDHESGFYGAFAPAALGTNHVGFVLARDL